MISDFLAKHKTIKTIAIGFIGLTWFLVLLMITKNQFYSPPLEHETMQRCNINKNNNSKSEEIHDSIPSSKWLNVSMTNTEQSEYQYFHIRDKMHKHFFAQNEEFKHWLKFAAQYPCYFGKMFIGDSRGGDVPDGGKWGCGVSLINEECIVYSFGSSDNFAFEYGILNLLPKCRVYTFDPFVKNIHILDEYKDRIIYKWWGLSGNDDYDKNMYTLPTVMNMLNHSYIDILKMDVEGAEWDSFDFLNSNNTKWPSIAQIMIEIHLKHFKDEESRIDALTKLFHIFESHNLRIFHREVHTKNAAEYALIQKNWKPHIKHYDE